MFEKKERLYLYFKCQNLIANCVVNKIKRAIGIYRAGRQHVSSRDSKKQKKTTTTTGK